MTVNPPEASPRHPSLTGLLFAILCLGIPLTTSFSLLNSDGDAARHLRHGYWMIEHGRVIREDPFSFTRPGAPFVGFEYGSQLLMALSDRLGGLAGLTALSVLLISASLTMLTVWLLRRGVEPSLVVVTALTSIVLSSYHWLARPHLISWPLILALLFLLERARPPGVWQIAGLFAVWANLHGAFVYGWVLMGLYLAGHLVEAVLVRTSPARRADELARARHLTLLLPVGIGATALNPYGWDLLRHVRDFFRDSYLRDATREFQSPNFHAPEMLPLLGVILLVLAVLAFRPRPRATILAVIAANLAMTLIAQRNVAMFALTAVPLLALVVNPWWADTVGRWPPLQRFGRLARSGHTTPLVLAGVAWLAVITLSRGQIAGRTIVPEGFSSTRFPVAAVTDARQAALEGRLFHEFIWGGYVLHAWPEQRVFIDGGTDFYGSALLKTHQAVIGLQPGWRDSLETYRIELVLVRSRSSLAAELARDATWRVWHCDSTAALFTRHQHDPPPATIPSPECLSR